MIATDKFDPVAWIEQVLKPTECETTAFIYDHMDSQSGECLAGIYQPFDPANMFHYSDRAAALDFLLATEGGKVLDFGPGDGWPSLIIAPYVVHVTGVDASAKRIEVCTANGLRMGIANAEFVNVPPGEPLPFADCSFDSVVAATSVEQTAEPRATLTEIHRILKPGGRLRMNYESLGRYRDGNEQDLWLLEQPGSDIYLILYQRDIAGETVKQIRLTLNATSRDIFSERRQDSGLSFSDLDESLLNQLTGCLIESVVCTTFHPCGRTWLRLLDEAGFSVVKATTGGGRVGRQLYESLAVDQRPRTLAELDRLLMPLVRSSVLTELPISDNPPLTAVR